MSILFAPVNFSKKSTLFQISTIVAFLLGTQVFLSAPKAEANIFSDTISVVANSAAVKYGLEVCGWGCAAVAVLGVHVVKQSIPTIADSVVAAKNGGIKSFFYNWGSTYFRP